MCASATRVYADARTDQRAALQAELAKIQLEIQQNQGNLAEETKKQKSLEREVGILNAQIKEAQLEIRQRDLTIQTLKAGIVQESQNISQVDASVAASQASLAQIVRNIQHIDDTSFVALALGTSLTDFFQDIDDFGVIKQSMHESVARLKDHRADLSAHKNALEDRNQEQSDLLKLQVVQAKSLKNTEKDKQTLITQTKGQESAYKKLIANKTKDAAQIEAALFSLADANSSVSFGDIYGYAKLAGAATNVRPALILAILAEESDLGKNVGTGNWKIDMHPTRDVPLFATICSELGLNPDTQLVSKKPWYGWGGAMGPAQFIPSTWVQYKDRIARMTGQTPPNPWNPRTAAFATALLMMDNGADAQTPAAERLAALRYLAGWKNASKAAYAFYGNDVMSLVAKYQSQIDVVSGS
jgi:peptidoglycan hydrolase CwlO-like protein